MTHPLGEHVERHPGGNRRHALAVAQALRGLLGTVRDPGLIHHRLDLAPGRRPVPGPKPQAGSSAFAQTVGQVQGIQKSRRHRHRPVDPALALFECLEGDHPRR